MILKIPSNPSNSVMSRFYDRPLPASCYSPGSGQLSLEPAPGPHSQRKDGVILKRPENYLKELNQCNGLQANKTQTTENSIQKCWTNILYLLPCTAIEKQSPAKSNTAVTPMSLLLSQALFFIGCGYQADLIRESHPTYPVLKGFHQENSWNNLFSGRN